MTTNNSKSNQVLSSNNLGGGKTSEIVKTIFYTDETETTLNLNGTLLPVASYAGNVQLVKIISDYGKSATTDKLLEYATAVCSGYVNLFHMKQGTTEATSDDKTINPMASAKKLLTSAEYRENCFKLANPPIDTLLHLQEIAGKKDTTKQALIDAINQLVNNYFTEEQEATYENMLAEETKLAEQFKLLTAESFTDIKRVSETVFSASIKLSLADNVGRLESLGYTLKDVQTDLSTMSLTVFFTETV